MISLVYSEFFFLLSFTYFFVLLFEILLFFFLIIVDVMLTALVGQDGDGVLDVQHAPGSKFFIF